MLCSPAPPSPFTADTQHARVLCLQMAAMLRGARQILATLALCLMACTLPAAGGDAQAELVAPGRSWVLQVRTRRTHAHCTSFMPCKIVCTPQLLALTSPGWCAADDAALNLASCPHHVSGHTADDIAAVMPEPAATVNASSGAWADTPPLYLYAW